MIISTKKFPTVNHPPSNRPPVLASTDLCVHVSIAGIRSFEYGPVSLLSVPYVTRFGNYSAVKIVPTDVGGADASSDIKTGISFGQI